MLDALFLYEANIYEDFGHAIAASSFSTNHENVQNV
jgi:hypothetical protein